MSQMKQTDARALPVESGRDAPPSGWLDTDFTISRNASEAEETDTSDGTQLTLIFAVTLALPLMLLVWLMLRYLGEVG